MSERNLKAARSYYEEVLSQGKIELIDELIHPDCTVDDPAMPHLVPGTESVKAMVNELRTAFPDINITITDEYTIGDTVILRWESRATHLGPLHGVQATGRAIHIPGIVIIKFSGSKMASAKIVWDAFGMHRQLGLIPVTAATA